MRAPLQFMPARAPGHRAFTIVELLVSVSILSVIVFTLYKVFDQTQKAMRSNITQVDVLESGRAAMDLLARDLQNAAASGMGRDTQNRAPRRSYSEADDVPYQANLVVTPNFLLTPTTQKLVDTNLYRTNFTQDFYVLTSYGRDYTGIGYRVIPPTATSPYGTLFRFAASKNQSDLTISNLHEVFRRAVPLPDVHDPTNEFARVLDGVVHFRVLTYDDKGRPVNDETLQRYAPNRVGVLDEDKIYFTGLEEEWEPVTQQKQSFKAPTENALDTRKTKGQIFHPVRLLNITAINGVNLPPGEARVAFLSNSLPAYAELEVGMLESKTLEKLKSFPNKALADKFLAEQAGKVHLFRQRIPLRASSR